MLKFSDISPSGLPLQLPMEAGKSSFDYIETINQFYLTNLVKTDYQETFVYQHDSDLKLDLVPITQDTDYILQFISRVPTPRQGGIAGALPINHPLKLNGDYLSILIDDEIEIEFLKNFPLNEPIDIFTPNHYLQKLTFLLNSLSKSIKWSLSTNASYSLAGITLCYYGKGNEVPDLYVAGNSDKPLAIIKTQFGNFKGVIYLQVR